MCIYGSLSDRLHRFLKEKGVKDQSYLTFLEHIDDSISLSTVIFCDQYSFQLSHFLKDSPDPFYDLPTVYDNLSAFGMDSAYLPIAIAEGDDPVLLHIKDGTIFIWLIENGEGELLPVAKDFTTFLHKLLKNS